MRRHWALAPAALFWAKAVATKAETTRRPCLPAWARRLRVKCLCQVAEADRGLETLVVVGDRLTPLSPRRARERRKSVQKVSASEAPTAMPRTSRRPWSLTATAMVTATETIARPRGPSHRWHPATGRASRPPGAAQGSRRSCVDLAAQPGDLALRDAAHAAWPAPGHRPSASTRPGCRPPGSPPSEPSPPSAAAPGTRGSSSPSSTSGSSVDRTRTCLPQPVAVAVSLVELRRALAMRGARRPSTSRAIRRPAANSIISRRRSLSDRSSPTGPAGSSCRWWSSWYSSGQVDCANPTLTGTAMAAVVDNWPPAA